MGDCAQFSATRYTKGRLFGSLVRDLDIRSKCSERPVQMKVAIQNRNFDFSFVNGKSTRQSCHPSKTAV
jgi:hypothetical protein